jgi:hypothetical protein
MTLIELLHKLDHALFRDEKFRFSPHAVKIISATMRPGWTGTDFTIFFRSANETGLGKPVATGYTDETGQITSISPHHEALATEWQEFSATYGIG